MSQLKSPELNLTPRDSLLQVLITGNEEQKMKANYELGLMTMDDSLETSMKFLEDAYQIASKRSDAIFRALVLERKGTALMVHGRFDASYSYFDSSLQTYLKSDAQDPGLLALYINYGTAHYLNENNIAALELYLKGYELCRNNKSARHYSTLVNNIGLIYKKLEHYKEALYFLQESAYTKEIANNLLGQANSLFNIGTIYVETSNIDSAVKYLNAAKNMYVQLEKHTDAESADIVLADLYYKEGNYSKARSLLAPFVNNNFSTVDKRNKAAPLVVLAGIALNRGNPQQALHWLQRTEQLDRQYIADREWRSIFSLRAQTYAGMQNFEKAYQYADSVITIDKKMSDQRSQRLTHELMVQLKTKEKESKIELLEAESLIADLELRASKRNNQFYLAGILIFAVAAFIFWRLGLKIRHQKKLIESNVEEQKRTVAMNSMIEGQESERLRIAKDLHDGLGGLLSTVKSHFSKVSQLNGEKESSLYTKTNSLIDEACIEVRRIAHNMVPHALSLSGLQGALEDLAVNLKSFNIDCNLEITELPSGFSESKTALLYRIIQELTQNVVKHSAATELLIQVLTLKDHIHITVEDNGRGFPAQKDVVSGGMGMGSVRSRVQYLKGKVLFDSVEGQGTTVTIEIPYND